MHLPDPVKAMLAEGDRLTQVQQLTKAVEQAIAPIIQRQIGHQKQLENLKAHPDGQRRQLQADPGRVGPRRSRNEPRREGVARLGHESG